MKLAQALRRPGTWMLGDGAMGTALALAGASPRELPLLPLTRPQMVEDLHLRYLAAGAQVLETHTFQANGVRLAALGLEADVFELNRRAAQLARHARDAYGEAVWILGSLGPLGSPVDPAGKLGVRIEEAQEAYRRQVAGLLAGGVDGFFLETMSDLETVRAAWAAVRAESDLPVLVSFAFSVEGTTLYGLGPEEAAQGVVALEGGPPAAAGANCGTGPSPLLDAILRMAPILRAHGVPLLAYPNAGQAGRRPQGVVYPAEPAYMARMASALVAAGVSLVGGCCGTDPGHIRAMAQALAGPSSPHPVPSSPPLALEARPRRQAGEEAPPEAPLQGESNLARALSRGEFVVSVELDPPRGPNPRRFLTAARSLAEQGVRWANVADSPMARVRMGSLATAALVQENTPLEAIAHLTTRDRNLMGLASDLLGAHALGVRNVLCLTGDPPGLGDYAHATAVYDVDSVGLVRILAAFNRGRDALGHDLGQSTRFTIGVALSPAADPLDREVERLKEKLEAGAHFVMTQPVYEEAPLERLLERLGSLSVPLLVGILPLVSYRQAEYLHHEVPGIEIPLWVRRRMEAAGADGVRAGVEMALELLEKVRPLVQGVYLVPSFARVEPLAELLAALAPQRQGGKAP